MEDQKDSPGIGNETFKIPLDEEHFHRFKTKGIEIKRPTIEYKISKPEFYSSRRTKEIIMKCEIDGVLDQRIKLDEQSFKTIENAMK